MTTDLIEAVARHLVHEWLADVGLDDLLGSHLAQPLAEAIGAIAGATGEDPDKELSQAMALFGVDAADPSQIANMIRNLIPDHLRTVGLAAAALLDRTSSAPPQADRQPVDTWPSLFEQLTGASPNESDKEALSSLQVLAGTGVAWDPTSVVKALRRLAQRLAALVSGGSNFPSALNDLDAEFKKLGPRIATAETLAQAVRAAASRSRGILIPSNMLLGDRLHREWQAEYRNHLHNRRHRHVHDGRVFGPGLPPEGVQLARRVLHTRDDLIDAELRAVYMARQARNLIGGRRGSVREDATDLTLGEVWEIKPITSATKGVVQEFFYRNSYNLYSAFLDDRFPLGAPGLHVCKPFKLQSGGNWPPPLPNLKYSFDPRVTQQPLPVVAFPLQSSALPGLVLYLTFTISAKLLGKLVLELKKLVGEVLNTAKRLLGEAERWWNRAGRTLDEALAPLLANEFVIALGAMLAIILNLVFTRGASLQPQYAPGLIPPTLDVPGRNPYMTSAVSPGEQGQLWIAGLRMAAGATLSAPVLEWASTTLQLGVQAASESAASRTRGHA